MRILHTADWHLGHTLRDHSRQREHEHFLRWLVDTVVERDVDVLLVAGDVFDTANPPPPAWRAWFEFLGELKRARPAIQVVVIAGNHDSGARLEAPRELLAAFDVTVVGGLDFEAGGRLATERLLVPLPGRDGDPGAVCVAIPFLRATDVAAFAPVVLPRPGEPDDEADDEPDDERDPLIEGMRMLHEQVFDAARAALRPGQALVAMAHGYLVGGMLSELSERKVLGGNQHALPVDLFPDECAYVALGHLHRPQPVAGREHVRYSGSPIPLSMPERVHAHHVVFADLEDGRLAKTWSLRVPQLVPMQRIPAHGALTPEAAFAAIEALPPRDPDVDEDLRPLLEVAVRIAEPMPSLGERVATACAAKNVRLARVEVLTAATGDRDRSDAAPPRDLTALQPEELFRLCYAREHEGEVPERLMRAFRELLDEVQHAAGGGMS
ncbi:MAG: exonuclease SbcCD subunit D C-terminal domain-containing protein [Planctomycetes bacterium]|nr:exonuclease SbcCD subunit D C-terminal domain-containing protein [Planctomycetota bacterium]